MTHCTKVLTSKATIVSAEPQLFVRDVERAWNFYREKLGFVLRFSFGEPPSYAQVNRDAANLNLRSTRLPIIDPTVRDEEELLAGTMTVGTTEEIRALFLEFQSAGVIFYRPLEEQPRGAENFIIKDLNGNLLLFAGPAAE